MQGVPEPFVLGPNVESRRYSPDSMSGIKMLSQQSESLISSS